MVKKILSLIAFVASLAACTDDFKDWLSPQVVPQPEQVSFGNGNISTVGIIDLNNITAERVKVCDITAPTSTDGNYTLSSYLLTLGEETFEIGTDGTIATADLQAYIEKIYTCNPIQRDIDATVSTWLTNGSTTVKIISDVFHVSAIPQAPVIEQAYYLTGSINGWDNTDTTYKLTNDGSDPYVNPIFKVRIPATQDGSNIEFKMTPESGLGGDWSGCLSAGDTEGQFAYKNAGGNLVIVADPDALFYDLTFKMLEQTWTATPVGFNEFIYEIGNESGWSEPHPLHGDGNGFYSAVIYLNGEFKFKPNKDNWDGDWEKVSGDATSGTLTTDGGPNMDGVAEGFYFVQVDLKEMTYKVTPVTSISIIGSVRGNWDTDIDMTYNEIMKCWEARETLSAGEFKFRLNHDWAINWGGSVDDLTQGGANLQIAADGAYVIRLFLSDEAPAHCTVKEDNGYPDNFYEIGNEGGWSTSHLLLGDGNGKYQGYYWLDGEFKFKPNADNWDNDLEYVSGDNTSGSLTDGGGPNCPDPGAGFYQINLDFANMHYSLTKIESVSLIGGFNDWGGDVDMTYNKEEGCWQVTTDAVSGEYKFRANHDWSINWGGSVDDLTQGGDNLTIDGGTHTFKLYLSYNGAHHVTIE
ncbi:MAG: DUF5115 domain-containing protein [Prevotella sp.]|nr:DUF5115 domain-containing protein [Prevotella sp.]